MRKLLIGLAVLLMAGAAQGDLVVHYAMDDATDTAPVDTLGTTPTTLVLGDDPVTHTPSVPGAVGTAIDFSANPGRAYAPNNAVLDTIGDTVNTTGLSVSFWLKGTASGAYDVVSMDDERIFRIQASPSHYLTVRFALGTADPGVTYIDNVLDSDWHLATMSLDFGSTTNNCVMYADGSVLSGRTKSADFSTAFNQADEPLGLATRVWGGYDRGEGYQGSLDDVALWDSPLTATEVKSLYSLANSTFDLNAYNAQQLWTLFAAEGEGLVAGDLWEYTTGLTGSAGEMDSTGNAIILDGAGNGMLVPEPATIALLGLGGLGLLIRRKR